MITRFLALALLAMTAACSAPSEKMDWKALTDYLDKQEREQ